MFLLLEVCRADYIFQMNDCRVPTKPSQNANWGAETCAKRKSTSPCLLAIPAFDRTAGLCNRFPNSNGEYGNANANDFGVRLKTLTDLARNECLVGPELIVGGINFGWLSGF